MEFDTETDPDTLDELFGEDADSLAEWVYFPFLLHEYDIPTNQIAL